MSDAIEHPEELLAAWARGQLSRESTLRLQEHVRQCEACSAQLHAHRDFESELATDELDAILNERAVQGALAKLDAPPSTPSRGKPWRAIVLAVAGLLLTGAVVAQWAAPSHREPVPTAPPTLIPRAAVPAHEAPKSSVRLPALHEPPAARPAPLPSAAPGASAAWLRQSSVVDATPAEVFARANELRRGGSDAAALGVYSDLQRRFPGSREALVSHAIAGRLLLEGGHANEAVAQFDQYLKRGDALAEDALVGRASALERLGRRAEEQRTWLELLRRFPHSVHATHARSRVEQLQ